MWPDRPDPPRLWSPKGGTMSRRFMVGLAAVLALTAVAPAGAEEPTDYAERYVPAQPGEYRDLTYFFGPYHVPPGQDSNRITVDIPLQTGFIVAIAPNLIDAVTGLEPTFEVAHIHHAHWFRVSNDPQYEYYQSLGNGQGLSWVFGTGEEKTQGRLDDRANVDPTGPRYGIFIDGKTPQSMIYMLHNKTAAPLTMYVTLNVSMIFGTLEQVNAADPARPMHPLTGQLWGQTRDANSAYPTLEKEYKVPKAGTAIAAGGHLHPGGKATIITNLGPNGTCTADADGDGYPGTTILNSRKFDRVPEAWPFSEDYQIGATKFGWRAPIRANDVLKQFGPYVVDGTASYEAMTYAGIYIDRLAPPAPIPEGADECSAEFYTPTLIGNDDVFTQGKGIEPTRYIPGAIEGMINHPWHHVSPHCGLPPSTGYDVACERPVKAREKGVATDTIHISGFYYVPGDQNVEGPLGNPPLVKKGTALRILNEDAAANVRHTITSCAVPCNGRYVANYPIPLATEGHTFDTGKLGNLDPIDGGLTGDDTMPEYTIDTNKLAPGMHAYYCRIHPFMRGQFEIVA